MTKGLESTLNLLNLRPSDLRKAQEVVPGENRPDLLLGGKPAPAGVQEPAAVIEGQPPSPAEGGERKPAPAAVAPAPRHSTHEASVAAPVTPAPRSGSPKNKPARSSKPRFSQLSRIDVRFRDDQIDFLTDFEIKLRRRDVREERLTKASIIRTVVDILPHIDLDLNEVSDEDSLRAGIFKNLGIPKNKPSQPAFKASKIA